MGLIDQHAMLLHPFCPQTMAKILALKATALLLLTVLIKARIHITTGTALGFVLLMLQAMVFLAISGGVMLAAGGAAMYATQKRKAAPA